MSYRQSRGPIESDGGSAIGPLIGQRRPRYEILHDVLGAWLGAQPAGEDVFFFVNIGSVLRQLFSEYTVAKLTRGELNRHPRALAAELVNIAGHYRNYAWKHFGRRSTVLLYHSTQRCAVKTALSAEYKANFYAKQLGGATPEFDVVRAYAQFNLRVARQITEFIPHVHLVDTGPVDPEAWPWTVAAEGRVSGSAVVLSSWDTDLQYALSPGAEEMSGREWAVLRASGDHSRLVTSATLFDEVLRKTKTGGEVSAHLRPGHFLYALALAGDDDLGAPGLARFGMSRAAKLVGKAAAEGRLAADAPNLAALLEGGGLSEEQQAAASRCWGLLVHDTYCAWDVAGSDLAAIDVQMVNRAGFSELEKANAKYFSGGLNLELLFAGEGY